MGYNETTTLKLKKPTALTSETDWPGYVNGNFDTLDAAIAACFRKDGDSLPDANAVRSLGSAILQFLNGYFSQLTLGGVTRSTWPAAGSGSQSMDDTYNNGSVINVDNTDEVHKLTTGKTLQITNADQSTVLALQPGQIKFPATQNVSADPNTLDDYEEGTWTAAFLATGGGTITISDTRKTGYYTKIGNKVTATGVFVVASVASPLNALLLMGLPFPCAPGEYAAVAIQGNGLSTSAVTSVVGYVEAGVSYISIGKFAAGAISDLAPNVLAGSQFMISATYFV